jgi:hypothetical protein
MKSNLIRLWLGRTPFMSGRPLSGLQTTFSASTVHGQRVINVVTPVPVDIVTDAVIVIEDGVTGKEEYAEVKSVNTGTGEIVLKNGLFFTHASGSEVKEVTFASKTEATHYTIDLAHRRHHRTHRRIHSRQPHRDQVRNHPAGLWIITSFIVCRATLQCRSSHQRRMSWRRQVL